MNGEMLYVYWYCGYYQNPDANFHFEGSFRQDFPLITPDDFKEMRDAIANVHNFGSTERMMMTSLTLIHKGTV